MKSKFFSLLVATATVLISCGVNPKDYFSNLLSTVQIGMSESDFKAKVQGEELVKSNENVSIYKVEKSTYHDLYGWRKDHRFFYFSDGKLAQIDQGERSVDYRVKVN